MSHLHQTSANTWVFKHTYPEGADAQVNKALDAREAGDAAQAEKLLRALLLVTPDHMDGLHQLGMLFAARGRVLEAYLCWREAVRVGLEGIPGKFSWHTGRMPWSLPNRPFMRAYHALSLHQIAHNELASGAEILARLVSVNPNDNLGARYPLMQTLLDLEDWDRAAALSRSYPADSGPDIAYSGPIALLQLGEAELARLGLERAVHDNRRVADELLKTRHARPPSKRPGYVTYGGADQAFDYWERNRAHWARGSAALELLREVVKASGAE